MLPSSYHETGLPLSIYQSILRRPTDIRKHRSNRRQLWGPTAAVTRANLNTATAYRLQSLAAALWGWVHLTYRKPGRAPGFLALCDDRSQFGVLSLLVTAQVDFPLEGPSAQVASEGLEAGVLAGVGDQVA